MQPQESSKMKEGGLRVRGHVMTDAEVRVLLALRTGGGPQP
jgi:hypothetical protein